MLRHRDKFSVDHEIVVTKSDLGQYETEERALGIPVHRVLMSDGRVSWFRRFGDFLRDEGPFSVVHSHTPARLSAPALHVAKRAGVPVRIAHSHSAYSQGNREPLRRRVAKQFAIPWLKSAATRRVGISELALEEVAGKDWRDDPFATVLLYGFDFSQFAGAAERASTLRAKLGIPDKASVIGHIGRFEPVKNHALLVDAFSICVRELPDAHFVLVGDGRLRDSVEKHVQSIGLADRVHFPGTTKDVAAFMSMFDLFVLPSFSEGLGIVVVEAQAAGTRALISERTPAEASVVPGAVEVLPLAAGPEAWGKAMARLALEPPGDATDWLEQVERSPFGIQRCIDELEAIYRSELERNT
jgi:glycosyltransferase involved in cell wall biosynthesis